MRYTAIFLLGLTGIINADFLSLKLKLRELLFVGQRTEQSFTTNYNECTFGTATNHAVPRQQRAATGIHFHARKPSCLTLLFVIAGSGTLGLWYADRCANKFLRDTHQLHHRDASMIVDLTTVYSQLLPGRYMPDNLFVQLSTIARELKQQTIYCDRIYLLGSILQAMPIERTQKEGVALRQQTKAAKQRLVLIEQKIGELLKQNSSQ